MPTQLTIEIERFKKRKNSGGERRCFLTMLVVEVSYRDDLYFFPCLDGASRRLRSRLKLTVVHCFLVLRDFD